MTSDLEYSVYKGQNSRDDSGKMCKSYGLVEIYLKVPKSNPVVLLFIAKGWLVYSFKSGGGNIC